MNMPAAVYVQCTCLSIIHIYLANFVWCPFGEHHTRIIYSGIILYIADPQPVKVLDFPNCMGTHPMISDHRFSSDICDCSECLSLRPHTMFATTIVIGFIRHFLPIVIYEQIHVLYTICILFVFYQWSDEHLDSILRSDMFPSAQTHRELKELLYHRIIDHFDKGKVHQYCICLYLFLKYLTIGVLHSDY